MQRGWSECPSPSVPAGEIERFVIEQIRSIGHHETLMEQTIDQIESRSRQQLENLESERKGLERQLRNDHEKLRAVAANTKNNRRVTGLAELQVCIDVADARLKELASQLESLANQAVDASAVKRLVTDFDKLWETMTPREQVRLTSLLVDKVEFDGVGGNIAITFHDAGLASLASNNAEALA